MKKFLILASLMLCATLTIDAQEYKQMIQENPAMASANMMYYHFVPSQYTPAPKGYKAFYISHYGRHGSRYDASDSNAEYVWPVMEKAYEQGLLSEAGKAFYEDLNEVLAEQEGMYGMLTSLGAREHREIAGRMAVNFPEVFKGKSGRDLVYCQSSTSPRCIMSMTNFTHVLDRDTDGVDFQYITGEKIYDVLAYHPKAATSKKMASVKEVDVRRATMDPMKIIGHFFNDTKKALEIIEDPYEFEQRLYLACCVGHLSDNGTNLLAHFPYDVLVSNFEVRNPRFYLAYGMSNELSEYQKQVSRRLLKDFIDRADKAMEKDSEIAADLRFGHDTGLLPLVGHMRIEKMDNWAAFDEVNSVWNSSLSICMASNLQMIFYRNRQGQVLVKMLYNETETTIPALETFSGPYYKWEELRDYLTSLL